MAWHYRDSETGRWVSEETYLRSTSHGGDRYQRESDTDWGEAKENIPQNLDDWYDALDDYGEFDEYEEADGGVDY